MLEQRGDSPRERADFFNLASRITRQIVCDPRAERVIECRFFTGLSEAETAEALGLSLRTVQRAWNEGREWLARHMAAA